MREDSSKRVVLAGSHRTSVEGAALSPSDPNEVFQVTLELRRKAELSAVAGKPKSHDAYVAAHGSSETDIAAVSQFAAAHALSVVESDAGKRIVRLQGKLSDLETAFGTKLSTAQVDGHRFRHREGNITLPAELDGVVVAVVGLDNRPQAKPHFRIHPAAAAAPQPLSPLDVASLYAFPPGNGAGATVAILEFGGGYSTSDLATYFPTLGLPVPSVSAVLQTGVTNNPGPDPNSDTEVTLDIEVAAAVAPAAKFLVYFASNDDQGFLWAVSSSIHATPSPTVVSISWGGPEASWTQQTQQSLDRYFQDAAQMGIPVTVAAGDNGATDGTKGLAVDFPSSSPSALSCGGTRLEGTGGTISSETVWNGTGATGGGISTVFTKPSYQTGIQDLPGTFRGVPDVAGNADPDSGYTIYVGGSNQVVGGTSAVAPLWAGMIARIVGSKPAGFLNPILYAAPTAFHDITIGNNAVPHSHGKYAAGPGWDPCTGLGSPNGPAIAQTLTAAP